MNIFRHIYIFSKIYAKEHVPKATSKRTLFIILSKK